MLISVALVLASVLTSVSRGGTQTARTTSHPSWGHGRIVERAGRSIFEVDGKPFFLYGAAFFYERLPRDQWSASMAQLSAMGINTLDLYVPWNWHELADGDFDFDGRTSPRRDFDEVLRLAKQHDFEIILRPGPVVRNEWRNGGYPAWLLSRPEYGMPLHDLLEGRYPPTATLQNQHSDDAAAQWMRNTTHVRYAKRWLQRVLYECEPYANRILAVALDDDQGAYIDNQTFPAPHFRAYLGWLRDVVHGVTGPSELTFINTYQMKVPASSPVWAMGNWYQSDAYSIGAHDESQLAFSFAQLATRPHQPLFASEFQAGWLQGAGEAYPRGADPSNTELAIATMIGTGVRGLVNFPAQDTLNPTGWEAPFANFAYGWDAALELDGTRAARYAPTAEFGSFARMFGRQLAESAPRYDAGIIYPGTLVDAKTANASTFSSIASTTIDAQQACRNAGFTCNLVDIGTLADRKSTAQSLFLLPAYDGELELRIGRRFATAIGALSKISGVTLKRVLSANDVRSAMIGRRAVVENGGGAVFSESRSGDVAGFLSVTNYAQLDRSYASAIVTLSDGRRIRLPPFVVRAHSALLSPIDARLARVFPIDSTRPTAGFSPDVRLRFTDCMFGSIEGSQKRGDPSIDVRARYHTNGSCTMDLSTRNGSASVRLPKGSSRTLIHLRDFHITRYEQRTTYAAKPNPAASSLVLRPGLSLVQLPATPATAITRTTPQSPVRRADTYREGADSIVFESPSSELIVSPDAGARSFYFASKPEAQNWFTTVGALRDDVAIEPPLSTSDRIAKYTHDFPAGTFNRSYVSAVDGSRATFSYTFADAFPTGARIEKTIESSPDGPGFDLDERVRFSDLPMGSLQRGVSVESLGFDPKNVSTVFLRTPGATAIVPGSIRTVDSNDGFAIQRDSTCLVVAWHAGDVEATSLQEHADSIVARLTLTPERTAHVIFRQVACTTRDDPIASVAAEAQVLPQVSPAPARTP